MDFDIIKNIYPFLTKETKEYYIFMLAFIQKYNFPLIDFNDFIQKELLLDTQIPKINIKKIIKNTIHLKKENINTTNPFIFNIFKKLYIEDSDELNKILSSLINQNNINMLVTSISTNNIELFHHTYDIINMSTDSFFSNIIYNFKYSEHFKKFIPEILKNLHDLYHNDKIAIDMYNSRFMSSNIYHDIEKNVKFLHNIKYDNIDLNIFSNDDNIDEYIYYLTAIKFMTNYFNIKINVDCKLWLTNEKKNINFSCSSYKCDTNHPQYGITSNNINSGMTIVSENVSVWRKEEVIKVIFHELIHYFCFDCKDNLENYANKLRKIYKLEPNNNIIINEAYTDFLAILFTSIFYSAIVADKTNININNIFDIILNIEIYFTMFQVSKILAINNINNIEKLKRNTTNDIADINKNLNIFSYYIIKSSLLFNINNMIVFMKNNNSNKNKYFKLTVNKTVIDDYFNIILESLENKKFKNTVNIGINYITTHDYKKIMNTFRMTSFEFDYKKII